jgi:gas vesicle protein
MSRFDGPTTMVTFILGLGVGAVTALLLAPKSGEELRGDIADGVNDRVNQTRNSAKKLGKRAQTFVERANEQIQDAVEAGEHAYSTAKKA